MLCWGARVTSDKANYDRAVGQGTNLAGAAVIALPKLLHEFGSAEQRGALSFPFPFTCLLHVSNMDVPTGEGLTPGHMPYR
jgi:hypothetical protein